MQGVTEQGVLLILAFSLALIIILWTGLFEQARFEKREAIAAAVRANTNRAIAFEQYVTRTLEAADAATLHVSGSEFVLSGTAERPRVIRDPVVNNSLFGVVSVANARGDIVATSYSPPPARLNVADSESFRVHVRRDTGRLIIGKPRFSARLGKALIGLSRRINNADGSFGGVINVQMEPGKFTDFYDRADVGEKDLMSVVGLDGITRARRMGARLSYGEDLRGMEVMKRQAVAPNGTYYGPGGLDGVVRYFSHRRLPDYPLFVTSGVAEADILAPLEERRDKYVLLATLFTLVTAAFAGLLVLVLRRRQGVAIQIAAANVRLTEAQRIGQIGDWDYDVETGVMAWSDQLNAMYERDPRLGATTREAALAYLDEQGQSAVRKALDRATSTGEPQEYETCVLLPSGRISYRNTVAVPTLDASGKVIRIHGVVQDISNRKTMEALQAQLAHVSRIDAMNTMAATLAHELNQPLAAATNYLAGTRRLMDRRGAESMQSVREGLHEADRQIALAAEIIRRARDMVTNRGSSREPASLPAIVEDALALTGFGSHYPAVTLTTELHPATTTVHVDRIQVQQVLINLVRNACEAAAQARHQHVAISSAPHPSGLVRVCVADNGTGIPESVRDLFSPFDTSKPSGLGLGLSISRTIIEGHGGRIWVERTGPVGTTICFTIPSATETRATAASKGAAGTSR